jgi:hypothetical protein
VTLAGSCKKTDIRRGIDNVQGTSCSTSLTGGAQIWLGWANKFICMNALWRCVGEVIFSASIC